MLTINFVKHIMKYTIIINDLNTILLVNYKYSDRIIPTSSIDFKFIDFEDSYSTTGSTRIYLYQSLCELFSIPFAIFYDYRTGIK